MSEFYKTLTNPKGKFGIWGIVALICLGVALMVVPGIFLGKEPALQPLAEALPSTGAGTSALSELEKDLAGQVSQILSQVQGAGQVVVTVSLASGPEHNYAQNTSTVKSNVEEKDTSGGTRLTTETNEKIEVVFAQGKGEALVIKEMGPQIKGVLVVAEGAKDAKIRADLSSAVQTMLNLPAHRVMVLPKEGR